MARAERGRRWLLALIVVGAAAAPLRAAMAGDPRPGLQLFGGDLQSLSHAPRLHTDVAIAVTGMLARVAVTQRFVNPGDDWVEGVYVFPLPEDAAVDRLQLHYAGRRIVGEVREREQARRDYAQAREQGRGATLLDQQRANVFTTSVANIPPRATVEVRIEYQQVADWRDRAYSLRFPSVVAPRYIPGEPQGAAGERVGGRGWAVATDQVADASRITPPVVAGADRAVNPLAISVDLDAGLPLAVIDSPYHRVDVAETGAGRYRVVLADGVVPAERDFVLRWQPQLAEQPSAALFVQRWRDRHYSLLTLMPPHAQAPAPTVARELVLVVDTSGSMHGASIEQARGALATALGQLRPGDRFDVIQFNDSAHSLFGRAVPANAVNLGRARSYVAGLRAEGGTEMLGAMRLALHGDGAPGLLRQVVFLTDGAVGNEQALFATIAERLGDSRLFTVGIGSAPNGLFMRKAARFGRGTFSYIGSAGDVATTMTALFSQLRAPALTDVTLHWQTADGRPVDGQAPGRVPDLYAAEPLSVAVRAPSAVHAVRITGRRGDRPWTHTVTLRGGAASDAVHVLWARRTIDDLLVGRVLGEPAAALRDAVIALALEHHLVTRFTSLVAVDRSPSRPPGDRLQRGDVPVRLPAGWSADAVFGRLPGTASLAALYLIGGLLSLGLAAAVRRRR